MPRCPHCLKSFSAPIPNMHYANQNPKSFYEARPDCQQNVPAEYITSDLSKVDCRVCLKRAAKRAQSDREASE